MRLLSVKIPSTWADGSAVAHFKLGLGPCGKTVTRLDCNISGQFLTIRQFCSDGEMKLFHYPVHTLTGRITEEFGPE